MKLGKAIFALSGLAFMSLAAAAFADNTSPYVTYNVRLEANPVQTTVTRMQDAAPVSKDQVAFRIMNNSNKAAYFMNGTEKTYIPMVSENTVTVPYSKDEYKVTDEAGNTMASWHVAEQDIARANVTSATSSQFQDWGQQLQSVIRSAQNRTVSYDYQQNPTMATPAHNHGTTVRGYW